MKISSSASSTLGRLGRSNHKNLKRSHSHIGRKIDPKIEPNSGCSKKAITMWLHSFVYAISLETSRTFCPRPLWLKLYEIACKKKFRSLLRVIRKKIDLDSRTSSISTQKIVQFCLFYKWQAVCWQMIMKLQDFYFCYKWKKKISYILSIFFNFACWIWSWGLFFCLLSEKYAVSQFLFFADWQLSMFITNLSIKSYPEMSVCLWTRLLERKPAKCIYINLVKKN